MILIKVFISFLALYSVIISAKENNAVTQIRIHEMSLRSMAVSMEIPKFPDKLIHPLKSVSVAEITFDVDGLPKEINILQSASEEISKSMLDALWLWRIKPDRRDLGGNKAIITSKITYYFISDGANNQVYGPEWEGNFNQWTD